AACAGGTLEEYGAGWRRITAPGRLSGLAADRALWVWGPGGLWSGDGRGRWTRRAPGPVRAAAALGGRVAWASAGQVPVLREGKRRVLPLPEGTTALAWEGPDLWALTAHGLRLSGGGVLPWRPVFPSLRVAAMAGGGDSLWLGLDDGRLLAHRHPPCASPWEGVRGSVRGRLAEPRGLAVSPEGWFAVADTQNHRIQFFTLTGACLDARGSKGSGPGQFHEPSGLALAADGTLAIADTWNGRVQLLDPDGSYRIVGKDLFGPRGVVWTPEGKLLVADTGNRRVLSAGPPDWKLGALAELDGPVVGLAVLGDELAAAVPQRGVVEILDLTTGSVRRTLKVPGWKGGAQQEGYLLRLGPHRLLASAPVPGELWLLDPAGKRPPRRVASGLPSLTALALLPDGRVLGSETFANRLVRIPLHGKRAP
ncbi:MAG TPA: hypothetical protein ENK19_12615, partial [Acidobacteria bacterium]|nr:hypothetical protein [Acidobacteriota bacterium]